IRRSIGIQSVVPCRWLTTATRASIRSRYSAYSGTSWREGWRWAMKVTCSRNSGCCVRKVSKAAEHVLRQVGAVDPDDQVATAALEHLALGLRHLGRGGCAPQSLRVDPQW